MSRNQLVEVAQQVVQVVQEAGLLGSPNAFRMPQGSSQHGAFSQPPDGWLEWEQLREGLPEIGDAIIIAWLTQKGSLAGDTGRVLYKGLQRVMDLGTLGALRGIPCGEGGGILHLSTT